MTIDDKTLFNRKAYFPNELIDDEWNQKDNDFFGDPNEYDDDDNGKDKPDYLLRFSKAYHLPTWIVLKIQTSLWLCHALSLSKDSFIRHPETVLKSQDEPLTVLRLSKLWQVRNQIEGRVTTHHSPDSPD